MGEFDHVTSCNSLICLNCVIPVQRFDSFRKVDNFFLNCLWFEYRLRIHSRLRHNVLEYVIFSDIF